MRQRRGRGILLVLLAVGGQPRAAAIVAGQQAQPPQSTFRSGVTAVPIDVRVLDRQGKPVTDLRQEDFTVFEDDDRQRITHFSRQVLVAGTPGPSVRATPDIPAFDASPQNHRVFLILLGAGALGSRPLLDVSPSGAVHGANTKVMADPSKAIDGLVHLLRDRLLPQDQVALLAYSRASDFSTDHEALARLLEAFREGEQAGIAALVRHNTSAIIAAPADSVFGAGPVSPPSELGFAEYVEARNQRTSDLQNLYYGIKYLRYMAGEKHLIYVTARGMIQPVDYQLPGVWDDPHTIAAAASDARVVLHVIQTGGFGSNPGPFLPAPPVMTPVLPGQPGPGGGSGAPAGAAARHDAPRSVLPDPAWSGSPPAPGVPVPGTNALGLQALNDLRTMASLTGGHASILRYAEDAVDRIDEQTRIDYLLAYYSSNPVSDGRYRRVRVEVNRPDVQVLFRHGYRAKQQTVAMSRRAVVTAGRLAAAMSSAREVREIALSVSPTFTGDKTRVGGEMVVRMSIGAGRLGWAIDDLSRHVTHLDVAVYCGDAREKVVGEARRALDIVLTDRRFTEVTGQGLSYTLRVPVTARASFVKAIVYNYDANVLGSTVARVR